MNYEELRLKARTGDLLFLAGNSLGSKLIRVATGSQYSHVAMLKKDGSGLWVCEMLPKTGYTITPASQRIPQMAKQGVVRYGRPSFNTMEGTYKTAIALSMYRDGGHRDADPAYSFLTLLSVWWAQWTRRKVPYSMVCSTFAQKMLKAGGMSFEHAQSPMTLAQRIESLVKVEG